MKMHTKGAREGTGTYFIVGVTFLILACCLQGLIWVYWNREIKPRLNLNTAFQADVLAHAQAVKLADALTVDASGYRLQVLKDTINEILLFTGPGAAEPMFLGMALTVDYEVVNAAQGSLDLTKGIQDCESCYLSKVPLYSPISDELLGIASFRVSNRLFQQLSRDVKQTLFTQSELTALLLVIVWGGVTFLMREINRSRHQAEMANRAKSDFLANMSHELRTPLNAVIGFSELMLRDPKLPEKHIENLAIVNKSGSHLLDLINDVLEISRIEATQEVLVETSFDLYETLDNIVNMIRLKVEKKGLEFIFERAEDTPRYVKTDERKLRQILLNILGNAVKFTDKGWISLKLRPQPQGTVMSGDDSIMIVFDIEDTGPGISMEERASIFEAFAQASMGRAKKSGAGLGLSISKQFVEHLGGKISLSSVVGKGSVFSFTIKAGKADTLQRAPGRSERRIIGIKPCKAQGDDLPYRILVVDDHDENRSLLRRLLEHTGFCVKTAENGRQAVAYNETWQPHLIWMDMRMPVMDGYEATKQIYKRKLKSERGRPVIIALTASAFKKDRDAVLAAGCDDFIRRPFQAADILGAMEKHLGVSFIYEEITPAGENNRVSLDEASIRQRIANLPEQWRSAFRAEAGKADFESAAGLLQEIKGRDKDLARVLEQLLNEYRFDRLRQLLDEGQA